MNERDAQSLIASAVSKGAGVWADFGAGDGTFTRALLHVLGPEGRVYAVDRDPAALETLRRRAERAAAHVIPVVADLFQPLELPDLAPGGLDGLLVANTLHFFPDPAVVLARLVAWLRPGGRAVVVEYDGRRASRWVPYPIARVQLPEIVRRAGLSPPTITATKPSAYGGTLYVAATERSSGFSSD